jgi:DNA-binding Lrp family transcriptional regulator
MTLNVTERRIVEATQAGLPLSPAPYAEVAAQLGLEEREVIDLMRDLQARGVIRRIGIAPNHYALGMVANGMSVWDVDDARVGELGRRVGALAFVTHCYRRPRRPPDWPYNLFAMVHGRDRAEVARKVERIADLLGPASRAHEILYSTRILKKTGLRLRGGSGE